MPGTPRVRARRRALPAAPLRPQTAKVHTRVAQRPSHPTTAAQPPTPRLPRRPSCTFSISPTTPPGSYPRLPRSTRSPPPLVPTAAAAAGSASDSRSPSTPPSRAVQPLPRVILRGPVVHWMDRGEAWAAIAWPRTRDLPRRSRLLSQGRGRCSTK